LTLPLNQVKSFHFSNRRKISRLAGHRLICAESNLLHTTKLVRPLTLQPIGLSARKADEVHALHQPAESAPEQNILELLPDCGYEKALQDLAAFRASGSSGGSSQQKLAAARAAPRGPAKRRGLFATRSPHRPNRSA